MKKHLFFVFLLGACLSASAQESKSLPQPDERFKVDLMVVVAHPDDEAAATPYLARALDEHRRIAVVFGTKGSSGSNQAGSEQAAAMGDIREIEARNALASLAITNVWFIDGKDTPTQNVLQSLANWGHGQCLEQLVRLIRLTRPEVLLTFLPGTFIGEDHGDHQASGVLTTEAFDLAGDPASFPEQLAGQVRRSLLENLRPWQPKKIYYFPDADREDIFRGKGPEYSIKDVSKLSKQPYWRMAFDSFRSHQTQGREAIDRWAAMDDAQLEKIFTSPDWYGETQRFVLGKSLVGGKATDDIFEGITPGAIAFAKSVGSTEPAAAELSLELGGPYSFYAEFRRAHGLTNLPYAEPPEIALQGHTTMVIPLRVHNRTNKPQEISLSVTVPEGWEIQSGAGKFTAAANLVSAAPIEIMLPAVPDKAAGTNKPSPAEVKGRAESNGKTIGEVTLRVELRKRALPQ